MGQRATAAKPAATRRGENRCLTGKDGEYDGNDLRSLRSDLHDGDVRPGTTSSPISSGVLSRLPVVKRVRISLRCLALRSHGVHLVGHRPSPLLEHRRPLSLGGSQVALLAGIHFTVDFLGGVRERPNRHDWKSCEGKPSVGSNPTSSAVVEL
jgi:hypothetical protein